MIDVAQLCKAWGQFIEKVLIERRKDGVAVREECGRPLVAQDEAYIYS